MIKRNRFGYKYVIVPTNNPSNWSISSTIFTSGSDTEQGRISDDDDDGHHHKITIMTMAKEMIMLSGSLVTTARNVLRLRMDEMAFTPRGGMQMY
jgi:hypothetical protein